MKRIVRDDGGEELHLNRLERVVFAPAYRGKLRLARAYSRLCGLDRQPFQGVAHAPLGRVHVDTRQQDDWALLFGGMEQSHLRWLGRAISLGGHAWDVGAHHGYYSLALGRLVGSGGRVHAFEPFPESAEICRHNVALNGLDERVSVHTCAVAAVPGSARLQLSENGPQNHSLTAALAFAGDTIDVEVTSLDAELSRHGLPNFVKIDVEGGEAAVLEGGRELLGLGETTFLFESEVWDENRSQTHELFRANGYVVTSLVRAHERPGTAHRMLVAHPPAST